MKIFYLCCNNIYLKCNNNLCLDEGANNMDKRKKSIKPCWRCGGKAIIVDYNTQYGTVTVGCDNEECDVTMGKGFWSEEEAIDHWNVRYTN